MIPGVQDHAESRGRDVSVQPRFDLPVRIAVSLNTNGFGDTIISLAWLKALCRQTPEQILFDLYGRMNNLAFLTQGCSFVDGIYPPDLYPNASGYDAKIILLHHAVIDAISAHSLGSKSATLFETIRRPPGVNIRAAIIVNRPHFNGAWFSLCMMQGWDRWTSLWANQGVSFSNDVNFAAPLSADDLSIVGRYGLKDRGYIILHRGTDNARSESDRLSSTKVWPRKNFVPSSGKSIPAC